MSAIRSSIKGPSDPGTRSHLLLAGVADGLDVVAVRVTGEGAVVAGVILRPDTGLMQHLGADRGRFGEEPVDGLAAHRGERDVRLPEALAGRPGPDPELRSWRNAVSDDVSEVQHPAPAKRRQDGVVEHLASSHVAALYGEVIDHSSHPCVGRR